MKGVGTALLAPERTGVNRLLLTGFLVSILILIVTAVLSTWNHDQLIATEREVRQSQALLRQMAELQAEVLKARDAQRGFIITGQTEFLTSYTNATERLTGLLTTPESALGEESLRNFQFDRLAPMVHQVIRGFDTHIEARRTQGFDAAADLVSSEEEQTLLAPLWQLIEDLSEAEREQLTHREGRTARAESLAFWFNNSGRLLTLMLFAGVFFGLLRENQLRRQRENELRRSGAELEQRVAERTTALRQSQQEILSIVDREQRRIGHDLHDSLGQQLTAIEFRLHSLLEDLDTADLTAQRDSLKEDLSAIGQMTRDAIGLTRSLARGLTPVNAGESGLMEALDDLAQRTKSLGGPQCLFECPDPVSVPNAQIAGHLFRISQEAVNNALKHSGATRIIISLMRQGDVLRLCIQDNGRGFSATDSPGLGLTVMQHRANVLGASLTIESQPNDGVTIACNVPLKS